MVSLIDYASLSLLTNMISIVLIQFSELECLATPPGAHQPPLNTKRNSVFGNSDMHTNSIGTTNYNGIYVKFGLNVSQSDENNLNHSKRSTSQMSLKKEVSK